MEQPTQAEALPDIETVMAQVQVFASAWSLVGGRFDNGTCLAVAEQENEILADMIRRLFTKLESLRGSQQAERAVPAALPGGVWYVPCTAGAGTTEGAYQEGWNACIKAMLAAPVQQAAPAGDARYRLLEPGWDKIEASDEFLSEDSVTWGVDPRGVFVGMVYQGGALLPARRRIDAAIASQQP